MYQFYNERINLKLIYTIFDNIDYFKTNQNLEIMAMNKNNDLTDVSKFIREPFTQQFNQIALLFKLLQNNDLIESHSTLRYILLAACNSMLEAISNTIINSLVINSELKKGIDRLSLLNKFDLLLLIRKGQKLDYGNHLVGSIKTLINLRNDHIHPKTRESKFDSLSKNFATNEINFTLKETPKDFDILDILKDTFKFLDAYFIDWCNCNEQEISEMLTESVLFANGNRGILQNKNLISDKNIIEKGLQIKIKFLSFISEQ